MGCWDDRVFLLEMDQCLGLAEPSGMGTRACKFYLVTPKKFDYLQYYMIQLEQSHSRKSPGHYFMIGRGQSSFWLGHGTGHFLFLYVKLFIPFSSNFVKFWSSLSGFVLDIELAEWHIIKALGVLNDGNVQGYSFCPPKKYKLTKQVFCWTIILDEIMWSSGSLDYSEHQNVFL